MNISLITPAGKRSTSGNRATAVRWARILRALGQRVRVETSWSARDGTEMMVAIHAFRSAESIHRFRDRFATRPLVVLLAGTDVYRFQDTHREETHASMSRADRLVGLHDAVARDVPARFRERVTIIHQSARPLPRSRRPSRRHFDVCVVGHLREEKDPLRAALAARMAPAGSKLRVIQLGRALDARWQRAAENEARENPRYHWLGEVPRWRVRERFVSVHAMVISSLMEGGANVVSEAVVAGVPVLASDIAGNRGLLGDDHPALYRPGDTGALAALLDRAEAEPGFLQRVERQAQRRRMLFSPERERARWNALLHEIA